jgi:hypothetical protein
MYSTWHAEGPDISSVGSILRYDKVIKSGPSSFIPEFFLSPRNLTGTDTADTA